MTSAYEHDHLRLDGAGLRALFGRLRDTGHLLVGPTVADGAIVLDEIDDVDDLPEGWTDEQGPGRYRLHRRDDHARFGYAVGPHSWKHLLYPPRSRIWSATAGDGRDGFVAEPQPEVRTALIGVRPCELAALNRLDTVLVRGPFVEPSYRARRQRAFVVVVHCGEPAATCFCTSMHTGPKADPEQGYDLALTEVLDGGVPWYLVEVGSAEGRAVMEAVPHRPATVVEVRAAERVLLDAAARITKQLDTSDVREALFDSYQSPQWAAVGDRCLTCGSCTLVCPTCFCTTVEDRTDVHGHAERWRVWDTCFSVDFSRLASGPVRTSAAARYRHWITHKLAAWVDQFGESGCVGCGRCTTWCPVGIDIVAEATAVQADARRRIPLEVRSPT